MHHTPAESNYIPTEFDHPLFQQRSMSETRICNSKSWIDAFQFFVKYISPDFGEKPRHSLVNSRIHIKIVAGEIHFDVCRRRSPWLQHTHNKKQRPGDNISLVPVDIHPFIPNHGIAEWNESACPVVKYDIALWHFKLSARSLTTISKHSVVIVMPSARLQNQHSQLTLWRPDIPWRTQAARE